VYTKHRGSGGVRERGTPASISKLIWKRDLAKKRADVMLLENVQRSRHTSVHPDPIALICTARKISAKILT